LIYDEPDSAAATCTANLVDNRLSEAVPLPAGD
jgi:hypothetical protein